MSLYYKWSYHLFRQSIEELWKSLNDSNPDLIPDFEEFIDEMTDEVQTAQQALKLVHKNVQ